ncbi:uncharacterized protein LOC128213862 [Mya arenaria]|uniref:uncharacterized protein LOC128213862 n=1 Tax=Mya arenaria TaxID=6604 RepID=UPI0022E4DA87|nr:uncharacterized protein LOC128213862 [Mya arenaria]
MRKEFSVCPFSGGYNMKIKDKGGIDHACNFIDLPMRFESECLRGEGMTFDLRTEHCIGALPMRKTQNVMCVSHWREDGDVVTVLRDTDTDTVWCLRIPARNSFTGKTIMLLFTDVACKVAADVNYFTLELQMVPQNTLCTDEHANCNILPCTSHFESQCLRTCSMCDPNTYPTACDFPKRFRGKWFLNDNFGVSDVNITTSKMRVERIGNFNCISFHDSPPRKSKQFTTLSFFSNGCRPRYTCIRFKTLNSNVLGLGISQSRVWPLPNGHRQVGASVCELSNFKEDHAPIRDTFRTNSDIFKPIVSLVNNINSMQCPFHNSFVFNATLNNGTVCNGAFFKRCNESSHLLFIFHKCPYEYLSVEYVCLGSIQSKYWETITLIQNQNDVKDTRCIVTSEIEPGHILVLPAGECDQFSWAHVNAGIRKPSLDLVVTPENKNCRFPEETPVVFGRSTTMSTVPKPQHDAWKGIHAEVKLSKYLENQTHKHRHQNTMLSSTEAYDDRRIELSTENVLSSVFSQSSSQQIVNYFNMLYYVSTLYYMAML